MERKYYRTKEPVKEYIKLAEGHSGEDVKNDTITSKVQINNELDVTMSGAGTVHKRGSRQSPRIWSDLAILCIQIRVRTKELKMGP